MKLEELKGKTVGVCVSGGLDSKTICCVLSDAGVNVKAFSANVGQPDEKNIIDNVPVVGITGGAMTADEFVTGPLYIQGDHSDADFRNMVLTPLK